MKLTFTKTIYLLSIIGFIACNPDEKEKIDKEKPEISVNFTNAFPANCSDTLYLGENFTLKIRFSDNVELGSYNVDIHHNFDHHSHGTDIGLEECTLFAKQSPTNPFVFIQDFKIPNGRSSYETEDLISIPNGDVNGDYQEGDYHFHIQVTDQEGWSSEKAFGIKILRR